jgi:glycerophosphoryl diester phosphodiesterase
MNGSAPEVCSWLLASPIAHRGLFRNPETPENSLAAFQAAIDRRLPIELDVQLAADGVPVVFHDGDLARLTGTVGKVTDTPASDLCGLRLFGTTERIPALLSVLELVAGQVPLLIELKNLMRRSGPLERAVLGCLRGYTGEFALQSFNPLSVCWLRRNASEVCRGQLSAGPAGIPLASLTRPHFVAYCVDHLPQSAVTRGRERGMPILAWTVRTPEQRERAAKYADNIIFEE